MNKKIYSIQILRGIAAILVVYAHSIDMAEWLQKESWQGSFKYLQNFGAIGVDLFFVISGFVMVYVTQNVFGYKEAKKFFVKRIIRIYSLYLPLILLLILYKHPGLLITIKDLTLLPVTDTGNVFLPITIQVAWTLSFEMFFYLLMALAIHLSRGQHVMTTGITLFILTIFGANGHFSEVHLTFLTNPILLEFLFGLFIGWIYIKKFKIPVMAILFLLLISGMTFIILVINGYGNISEAGFTLDASSSVTRVILWGIPSAMFVAGLVFLESNHFPLSVNFLKNNIFNLLGNASYSIYLVHTILFSAVLSTGFFRFSGINSDVLILIFLSMACFVGIFVHFILEKPLLKYATSKILN